MVDSGQDWWRRFRPPGDDGVARRNGRSPSWHPATVEESTVHKDFVKEIYRLPVERRQLVFSIRRQLREGTYDLEGKLPGALSKAIDSILAGDPPPQGT